MGQPERIRHVVPGPGDIGVEDRGGLVVAHVLRSEHRSGVGHLSAYAAVLAVNRGMRSGRSRRGVRRRQNHRSDKQPSWNTHHPHEPHRNPPAREPVTGWAYPNTTKCRAPGRQPTTGPKPRIDLTRDRARLKSARRQKPPHTAALLASSSGPASESSSRRPRHNDKPTEARASPTHPRPPRLLPLAVHHASTASGRRTRAA